MPQIKIVLMQMHNLAWRWSARSANNVVPKWSLGGIYVPDAIDYLTPGEAYSAAEAALMKAGKI